MEELLTDLIGQRVSVWSGYQDRKDTGVLEGFESPWLRLRADDGDLLCFSMYSVRLVKGRMKSEGDHHLSPVEAEDLEA